MKIGFLGPRGTFTEEAIYSLGIFKEDELVSYTTVEEALLAADKGEVEKSVVPIENSIEGPVNVTLDLLALETNLIIEREIITPVRHHLVAHPGTKIKDISLLISHPQATAQCRKYLRKNLPDIPIEAANSTAEAVSKAKERGKHVAAIGTKLAAEVYGLVTLASDIEDYKDNQTRFVVAGKTPSPPTGNDKTSVACFIYEDRPGSLLQILQEFAYRYINLTKIQSRPTKKALGDYYFWIDLEGHIKDEVVASAIKCLSCKLRELKFLGSYPRADKG